MVSMPSLAHAALQLARTLPRAPFGAAAGCAKTVFLSRVFAFVVLLR
jgi:hypothetical protein